MVSLIRFALLAIGIAWNVIKTLAIPKLAAFAAKYGLTLT
jgi:hypothetical protein